NNTHEDLGRYGGGFLLAIKEMSTDLDRHARHDISPDQEEKNQRTETLATLYPNREHLFRLRRSGASQGFPRSVTC
ncbi:hypothetical protein KUCAC02_023680, partial [Chaenocephalus aceratus]